MRDHVSTHAGGGTSVSVATISRANTAKIEAMIGIQAPANDSLRDESSTGRDSIGAVSLD